MSFSTEFGYPIQLSSYIESKISETRRNRDLLTDDIPHLLSMEHTTELEEEFRLLGYWLWKESIQIVRLERADVRLSRGDPQPALQLLHEEIADINDAIEKCALKGCTQTAQMLATNVKQLSKISY